MAIENKELKIWGLNSSRVGEIGTQEGGNINDTLVATKDISNIQNSAFEEGFSGATINKKAVLSDIESAIYTATYGTNMIQRQGAVLPYLASVNYNINAPVLDPNNLGRIYYSLINNNKGNALTDIEKWKAGKNIFDNTEVSSFKKFTVNNSAVDVDGYASFINKVSDSEISFNVTASNPIIYTFANGTSQTLESLANVDSISGDSDYIVLIEEGSPTAILVNQSLNSVEEGLILPTGVDGDYYTTINPLKSYKKVSGSWIETNYVKLGEFIIASGVMGTPISYTLNRRYEALITESVQTIQTNLGTNYTNTFVFQGQSTSKEYGSYIDRESDSYHVSGLAWKTNKNTFSILAIGGNRNYSGDRLRVVIEGSF